MEQVLEKLAFQVKSFQEGFELLGKANSVKDLCKKFARILRGNLLTTDINLYFCPVSGADWQPMLIGKHKDDDCREYLPESTDHTIRYDNDSPFPIVAVLPMMSKSCFGVLIGPKLDKSPYTHIDRISSQIFLQLLDNAYQAFLNQKKEKELNFSLNHKILQLNSLIETGIEIARIDPDQSILNLALERVSSLTNAGYGLFRVVEEGSVSDSIYFPMPFEVEKFENSESKIESIFNFNDRKFELILFNKESRSGVQPFDMMDQSLLDAFSRQVHVSMENHFLYKEALEKQKIEQDISVAATIQQKIIPEKLPDIPGYDLCGVNIPTKDVGGDYYDCIPLKDGRFALIIADVSGKGVPAALLVSSLQALLTAYLDSEIDLPDLNTKLNRAIYKASTDDKYITFYIGILDPESGRYESFNAGHNPIYLLKYNGDLQELSEGGVPVGMMSMDIPGEKEILTLEKGDRLLLYTDGVTEAMNENEEEYDDEVGLINFFKKDKSNTARQFIDSLVNDIRHFTRNTPQSDDITALFLIKK